MIIHPTACLDLAGQCPAFRAEVILFVNDASELIRPGQFRRSQP